MCDAGRAEPLLSRLASLRCSKCCCNLRKCKKAGLELYLLVLRARHTRARGRTLLLASPIAQKKNWATTATTTLLPSRLSKPHYYTPISIHSPDHEDDDDDDDEDDDDDDPDPSEPLPPTRIAAAPPPPPPPPSPLPSNWAASPENSSELNRPSGIPGKHNAIPAHKPASVIKIAAAYRRIAPAPSTPDAW